MSKSELTHRYNTITDIINSLCQTEQKPLLVAVSKRQPNEQIQQAYELGQRHFAENRVQELSNKRKEFIGLDIIWHYIGKIQTNKINEIATHAHWVQSLDNLDKALKLNAACKKHNKIMSICLQVNLEHEEQKGGLSEEELTTILPQIQGMDSLLLRGLMILPKYTQCAEQQKQIFERLYYKIIR